MTYKFYQGVDNSASTFFFIRRRNFGVYFFLASAANFMDKKNPELVGENLFEALAVEGVTFAVYVKGVARADVIKSHSAAARNHQRKIAISERRLGKGAACVAIGLEDFKHIARRVIGDDIVPVAHSEDKNIVACAAR